MKRQVEFDRDSNESWGVPRGGGFPFSDLGCSQNEIRHEQDEAPVDGGNNHGELGEEDI